MKKLFYLSTCSTCLKIIKDIEFPVDIEKIDIKNNPIDEASLAVLFEHTQSYESLFSKKARKFQDPNLKEKIQSDVDYKGLLTTEYTFLKRPVVIYENFISVGSEKATVEKLAAKFNGLV